MAEVLAIKGHKRLKQKAREFFKKTKHVRCPAFPKESVVFNSKGLSHLFYRGSGKVFTRQHKESVVRVSLLPRAVKLLEIATLFQEESLFIIDGKKIRFWAFEGVLSNRRVKVVVRQVGSGNKHFWSVIPAWRRVRGKVVNSRGNLSEQ